MQKAIGYGSVQRPVTTREKYDEMHKIARQSHWYVLLLALVCVHSLPLSKYMNLYKDCQHYTMQFTYIFYLLVFRFIGG